MTKLIGLQHSRAIYALEPSAYIDRVELAGGVAERKALPEGYGYALFSASGAFQAKFGDNAVDAPVPGSDVADGSAGAMSPALVKLPAGATHVSLVARDDCDVTISYYENG